MTEDEEKELQRRVRKLECDAVLYRMPDEKKLRRRLDKLECDATLNRMTLAAVLDTLEKLVDDVRLLNSRADNGMSVDIRDAILVKLEEDVENLKSLVDGTGDETT